MFRNGLQFWHIIVIVGLVVLLFGAQRLPGLAKSVGQSMKIFRDEVKDLRDPQDGDKAAPADRPTDEPTEGSTPPKV
ncbi:twin-arginine translocase TatA/TatE family subunit [Cellulomonas sp. URHB0016]